MSVAILMLSAFVGAPTKLTLEDAEKMALEKNARFLAGEAQTRSAHRVAESATARLFPSIHVSEEFQHYDSPFDIAFGGATFRARDQNTNTVVVAADQPIVGLLRIHAEASARSKTAESNDATLAARKALLKEAIRKGYLRYFGAKTLEEIARASEAELADQVRLSEAKMKAGVSTEADVLRVKVALANAKQQEIVGRSQAEIARANVLSLIGVLADDATIDFEEPTELLLRTDTALPELADASRRAITERPEVQSRALAAEAADAQHRAAMYAMLPDINAEAAYLRVDGQVFAPMNSAFVGVKANWAIWEWGATYRIQQAASEAAEAARLAREDLEHQVGVEVATAISEAKAAMNAVKVAEEAISGAEEAYRETNAQVQAGSATTTDLLDAQAALTQAKLNLARARYEEAVARVSIARATGTLH
jgi:outer membrane protein TolC